MLAWLLSICFLCVLGEAEDAALAGGSASDGLTPEQQEALLVYVARTSVSHLLDLHLEQKFLNTSAVHELVSLLCEGSARLLRRLAWPSPPAACALLAAWAGTPRAERAAARLAALSRGAGPRPRPRAGAPGCEALLRLAGGLAGRLLARADVLEESLMIHELLSEALGGSGCCYNLVHDYFLHAFVPLSFAFSPLRVQHESKMVWQCLEWAFWGGKSYGSPYGGGIRASLWDFAVRSREDDYKLYGLFELLTTQLAFMPLCEHRTRVFARRAARDQALFFSPYENCAPTHLSYAMDHFIAAGVPARAYETLALLQSSHYCPVEWQSIHNTAIGFLPGVTHWPWWQGHPSIKPYIDFLEASLETLTAERALVEGHADLRKDAFPATSRDGSWHKLEFWDGSALSAEICSLAPKTCALLASLGWTNDGEIVTRKMMWTVVEPGMRFAGHSGQSLRINVQICVHGCEGSELHINGTAIRFRQGKAIAWQDGWRHEVRNSGSQPRWVFMITLPHPEYEHAWKDSNGNWPVTFEKMSGTWLFDGPYDRSV